MPCFLGHVTQNWHREDLMVEIHSILENAKRIVVKIGSAVLTDQHGLDQAMLHDLCSQMADLRCQGREVLIVSSGAVAAGVGKMPERAAPRTIPEKQALAAIGQGLLMRVYEEALESHGLKVAQVLLTRDGLIPRRRYVNAKNTIKTLLDWGVIPVINENDTVATEELQFTDNDALSGLVLHLAEADLLVCLSDIDGLYDRDPRYHRDAARIEVVEGIDDKIFACAGDEPGRAGRGGMKSKLQTAHMVTSCGLPMVVLGGRIPSVLHRLFNGERLGTFFMPARKKRVYGRKPWIAFALERKGEVVLDSGAVAALTEEGRSLLPVGITRVSGSFQEGDCIVCVDSSGREVAVGLSNYCDADLKKITGCQSGEIGTLIEGGGKEEVIHRDNMITLK